MREPTAVLWSKRLCALSLSAWVGVMAFFGGAVTPALFREFPDRAGALVAVLFPGYFTFGIILGGLAFLTAAWAWFSAGWLRSSSEFWRLVWAFCVLALVTVNGFYLRPMVRDAPAELFSLLHGLSMLVNGLSGIMALFGTYLSLLPRRESLRLHL